MKILHVIPFLWSGAGRVLTDLCLIQKRNHEVAIVTSGRSKGMTDWPTYRRRLSSAGVRHHRTDLFNRDSSIYWDSVDRLAAVISEDRPDVIHCHSGVPACAVAVIRDRGETNFRFIAQLHSWGTDRPEWMNRMDLWGFGRADRVIANAASYRDILIRSGIPPQKISIVPWGVSYKSLTPGRTIERNSARLGFVGRIEPRKGQLELVRAFNVLQKQRDGVRLDLVGPVADVSYAGEIEKLIRSRGLNRQVRLAGRVVNAERWLSEWDLFVSLSRDEGQGMAVLEAMAADVPVLARGCAGIQDYLRDGVNGVVLKSSAPAAVAQSITWALDHRGDMKRLSARAKKMVREEYSWQRTIDGLEMLYGSAAG